MITVQVLAVLFAPPSRVALLWTLPSNRELTADEKCSRARTRNAGVRWMRPARMCPRQPARPRWGLSVADIFDDSGARAPLSRSTRHALRRDAHTTHIHSHMTCGSLGRFPCRGISTVWNNPTRDDALS